MKSINIILLGLSLSLVACQSSKTNDTTKVDSITSIESGPGKIVDERYLIVPGRSVGEISLGENMEFVGEKLGRPDAGDAAMGKAWGIWYSKDSTENGKNELAIYSSYKDTTLTSKDVKQIRITSKQFKTQDGFGTERSFEDTQMEFPGIIQIATYLNQAKDSIMVYDSKTEGIGFEFVKGKSISLTVHPKNVPVNSTYLTLHPEWKLVEK